ncbi:hypothetical protein [Desulfobacter sp.]|uniref:hypothetical protein n=1 Tax=Desulfobacter sp. TaxID=2294 RepID=UPI003D117E18
MKSVLTNKERKNDPEKAVQPKEQTLQWVEIITARMRAQVFEFPDQERFFADIRASVDALKPKSVIIMIYHNSLVENDWSIHLHWRTGCQPPGKTELGIKLVNIVRSMALVDHTVWCGVQ